MKERLDEINGSLFDLIGRLLPNIGADSIVSILITAAIATLIAFILFILVRGVTKFIEKKILSFQSIKLGSLRFQHQEILTGSQISWG